MLAHPRFRWLPMPVHSLLLFVVWLLLNNTLAPAHLLLGGALALFIPLLVKGLQTPQPKVKKPLRALRYFFIVLYDIVTSNVHVARLVLGRLDVLQPAFIAVPLDLKGDLPLSLLAMTVSMTPGTVSCEFSTDRSCLYVHALHVEDQALLIETIKTRYEQPLQEIFGC
ncbi:Na+/H+ antiporter subunit E [Marinospirillum sp.]|uniref:Na+/H+ antiporter subunit E n=1 Tax=Marinospirillum sp. TaxID=2183934 RepID=UPI003A849CBE